MGYNSIAWPPLAAGLTTIGVIAGYYSYWRCGLRPALSGVAWSLLPIGALRRRWPPPPGWRRLTTM